MNTISREEIEKLKQFCIDKPSLSREATLKLIESHEAAVEIIKRIPDFGPEEPSENACWFCDMGNAGYSSKGKGFHDDTCLWGESRAFLQSIETGGEEE